MIQITPQMRILLGIEPIDFRKGIDGIAGVCRNVIAVDPFTGYVFVFRNRLGTSLKILMYDGQGFWLCQKRFSKGRLSWWPKAGEFGIRRLTVQEFQVLLWNGNPEDVRIAPSWKPIDSVCFGLSRP
jgi:transposase